MYLGEIDVVLEDPEEHGLSDDVLESWEDESFKPKRQTKDLRTRRKIDSLC